MIQGKNIKLRTIRETDLDFLFTQISNLHSRGEYYPLDLTSQASFNQEYQQTGFWTNDLGRMLIEDSDKNIVGGIWYFKAVRYSDALELGYLMFDKASCNQGYTTEAVQLLCKYLFATRRVNRIQLAIVVDNAASVRVAEKAGFQYEATLKQFYFLNGNDIDVNLYVLLREYLIASNLL